MRYILSGIAGVLVSFSLFLIMTHLIKQDDVKIVEASILPPIEFALVEKEVEPVDDEREPPPKPIIEPIPRYNPILGYDPETNVIDPDFPDIPSGAQTGGSGDVPIFKVDYVPLPPIEPETKFPPRYPSILQTRGIEGYVLIENTIGPNGRVVHVEIIESSHSGFERAVKNSAVRWTYAKSDQPRRTHREKVAFVLED